MKELVGGQFERAVPLFKNCKQSVLPMAVCQGYNPGRIFVDQAEDPKTVLLTTLAGYYFLAGARPRKNDGREIARILVEQILPAALAEGENGFLLVPPAGWEDLLPILLPSRNPSRIYRRTFAFNPARFADLPPWRERIPAGFHLRRLEKEAAQELGGMACWRSVEDFLRKGIGFGLFDGEVMASVCYSVFASREAVELDIKTEEKYRRQGLATLAASAFIEECLQLGKRPNWECFWDNEASARLAESLGYARGEDYPVYFWEEFT